MDRSGITLDLPTREQLAKANGLFVELYDDAGRVIGYFLSPERQAQIQQERKVLYSRADLLFPPERIEAALNDPRPNHTMEEVLRLFEGA